MKILTVGGGPGGLYASLLLKKANPSLDIQVIERNPAGATYGWGVVFSDRTLNVYREADSKTYQQITDSFVIWTAIDTYYRDTVVRCEGHSFAGMYRRKLLQLLQERCRELGVRLTFDTEFADLSVLADYDLVIAADGVNSKIRHAFADKFQPTITRGAAKYIWFGTDMVLDAFTFYFRENEHGLFQAHAYPFDGTRSTFIVECEEDVWRRAGLDGADEATSVAYCEGLFAQELRGRRLLSNKSQWLNFHEVRCKTWRHKNIILLGDAAHTAHFSIGSGTKLAMDGAVALVNSFIANDDLETALRLYELERRPRVESLQAAAVVSQTYFENMRRYTHLEPLLFTSNLLTRSGRITYDNLRVRDPYYIEKVDQGFGALTGVASAASAAVFLAPPPLFNPYSLRGMTVPNRVAVQPTLSEGARDGVLTAAAIAGLVEQARGGVGLVVTGETAVSPTARITPDDPGLYSDEAQAAWAQVADALHSQTKAMLCVQLNHAGRRGATRSRRRGLDIPLQRGAWPLVAPSSLPYAPTSQRPAVLDEGGMGEITAVFAQAAERAAAAGVDMLLLNMGHGYLLGSFLSPLSNQRQDEYGGSLENRMRFPLAVLAAVRGAWPEDKPLAVALNVTDWAKGGVEEMEGVAMARVLKGHGVDLLLPLAGQTIVDEQPTYGAGFLTTLSELVRHEAGLPTMVGGYLRTTGEVNGVLAAGRADLCVMS